MIREEPHRAAFEAAARATRARILRDRARAPRAVRKVFTVVASRLFDPDLDATRAFHGAGSRDRTLGVSFKEFAGVALKQYINAARIEVASVLMITTDLDLMSISECVGYIHHTTFSDNFRRHKGIGPRDMPREPLTPPLIHDVISLQAGRGLLDDQKAEQYLKDLQRIYPKAAERAAISGAAREPRLLIDGARTEQLQAEGVWREIRDLPFAAQCQYVRSYLFGSTVLFDLLRERSRVEGRKSRQRGIELAELALVSLEGSDSVFGERVHDLRALAWAWLGNAHRLALDFSAAAAAFEQADREWETPRAKLDLSVLGHVCCLKGVLRMMQREYVAATDLLDRSCSLFREVHQTRDEALALIHRAMIHGYAGKLRESIKDLREASCLIHEDKEAELAFAIRGNLANTMARAGRVESATKELGRARQLSRNINDPLGTPKLDWIAGLISEHHGDLETARKLYSKARTRFHEVDEIRCFGLISVDLMIVHSMKNDWERVGALAAETLPILDSLRLSSEAATTVGVLAKAIESAEISSRLLTQVRAALQQEPLAM